MSSPSLKKIAFRIVLGVFVLCVAGLSFIAWTYLNQSTQYEALEKMVTTNSELAKMSVDWEELESKNPDVVAWVVMPGTNIDYPVVQGTNNKEYLQRSFWGTEGSLLASAGSIFADCQCPADLSGLNTVLYGHHMRDGSMFADVASMVDQQAFDANRTFYVLTPQMNYEVTTIACTVLNGSTDSLSLDFATKEDYANYLETMTKNSTVTQDDIDVSRVQKSFMLVTCEYSHQNGRAVLTGAVTGKAVPVS